MLSCLLGALLILMVVQIIICFNISPTSNRLFFIHFFLSQSTSFSVINTVMSWVGLNPDESIPRNIRLTVVVRRMKEEEIILSRMNIPVILSVNFCNVVK